MVIGKFITIQVTFSWLVNTEILVVEVSIDGTAVGENVLGCLRFDTLKFLLYKIF